MMKRDQKGFTIVELIIAVAILAIVVLAVGGFMVVGSRSYTNANTDIMLQQDAQLALNQMSDVIIDTTDSISYSVDGVSVLKDAEYGGEATNKTLVVVNRGNEESNNNNKNYWFRWVKDPAAPETETGVIYFNEVDVTIDPSKSEAEQIAAIQTQIQDDLDAHFSSGVAEPDTPVLAEHVQELSIDISQFEENRVVMIAMAFENGGRQYATSNNVTVRNRIALNTIDVDPMKLADTFVIDDPGSIIIEPGESYTIPMPAVTSTSPAEEQALTWKSTPDITPEGTVQIELTDTRESFNVRVERLNEQYAGQNDRVAKTVKVRIKRATAVNITCAQTTIEAGQPVNLTASVNGNALGEKCVNDGVGIHETDDINKDKDVTNWRIVSGAEFVEGGIDGSSNEHGTEASLTIKSTAAEGSEIVIEADSALSVRKPYATVTGRFVIRVDKGISGDYPLQGNFKLGTWDDPGILDYMKDDLSSEYGSFIYCVRVREAYATNAANDTVVIYHTTGANVRFFPDILGLKWDRSYKILFQVLSPVPASTWDDRAHGIVTDIHPDDPQKVVQEYLAHTDPTTGEYTGTAYKHGAQYGGMLEPPVATFECNGVTYPNPNKDYCEYYHYQLTNTANETVLPKPNLGESTNIAANAILNQLVFSVYKGEGNDPAGWEDVYVYQEKNGKLGYTGPKSVGPLTVYPDASEFLKKENNKELEKSVGTYHVIPGFHYANNWDMTVNQLDYIYPLDANGKLDKSKMGMHGEGGDYEEHYYPQKDAMITVKVDMGFNIELPSENGEQRFSNFPVPTDFKFPFVRKSKFVQTKTYSLKAYTKSGEEKQSYDNILVDCEYVPGVNGKRDSYTIWLYTESNRNGASYTRNVIGKYTCAYGDEEWQMVKWNDTEDVKVETNINYKKDDHSWEAYFPYPSENDFPFKGLLSGESEEAMYRLQAYNVDSNYEKKVETLIADCKRENDGNYVLTLKEIVSGGAHKSITKVYGQWQCGANGNEWKKTREGSETATPIWGSRLYFTYSGQECMMEVAAPSGRDQTISGTKQYYLKSDTYGENPQSANFDLIYKKEADGSYTVTLRTKETQGKAEVYTNYGKGKWNDDTKSWDAEDFEPKVYVPVGWGTLVHFTYNGKNYKVERPLPNEAGFPTFSETYEEDISGSISHETNMTGWYQDGQDWLGMVAEYRRDASGKCTLTLRNPWSSSDIYGTWTWEPGQTEWQKQ